MNGRRWLRTVLRVLGGAALVAVLGRASYDLRPLGELPRPSGQVRQRSGADWGRIVDERSGCVLVNNVWNKSGAGRGFEQEVFLADEGDSTVLGWRWRSPWQFVPHVLSQPEIVCGDKPWDPPSRLLSGFPFRVAANRVGVDFDVRLRATGTYNMAFTMWVVSALPANRENISHEVMIWNATGHQRPAGTHSGVLEVNHVQYDVYVERAHGDASGRELSRWTYVAFVGRRPVFVGRLDLSAFLDDMLTRGLVSEDHYVTSVELGDEVSEGTGLAEVRRFSVVVGGR